MIKLWNKKGIKVVDTKTTNDPQKIRKALNVIQNIDSFPFCFENVKEDGFGFDRVTYEKLKRNYNTVKKSLMILLNNGFISSWTLLPTGRMKIRYNTKKFDKQKTFYKFGIDIFKFPTTRSKSRMEFEYLNNKIFCNNNSIHKMNVYESIKEGVNNE